MSLEFYFLLCLPITAFLYAAVGHGGASGYLALMALFSFAPEEMKPTALLLNLFVAGIAFYHYWKIGTFKLNLFLVFAIGSIPFSFLGGMMTIDAELYKLILGILLIFAILRILNVFGSYNNEIKKPSILLGLMIGSLIGFFSGLIGIGGGIILTPAILLLRWGTMKQAAAVSALFIWVNSLAGISGQFIEGIDLTDNWVLYVSIALVGGFFGSYFGSRKMDNQSIRYLLAFVLILASLKLMLI